MALPKSTKASRWRWAFYFFNLNFTTESVADKQICIQAPFKRNFAFKGGGAGIRKLFLKSLSTSDTNGRRSFVCQRQINIRDKTFNFDFGRFLLPLLLGHLRVMTCGSQTADRIFLTSSGAWKRSCQSWWQNFPHFWQISDVLNQQILIECSYLVWQIILHVTRLKVTRTFKGSTHIYI